MQLRTICRPAFFVATAPLVFSLAHATSVIAPKLSELVARADYIVRTETKSVRTEWRGENESRRIVTIVSVQVLEPVVGKAPPALELEFLGGTLGGESMRVIDQPHFSPGDRDILFVENNGRQICPLVHMGYGRYPLVRDRAAKGREAVARGNGEILASVDEISRPFGCSQTTTTALATHSGLAPAAFEAKIKQVATELGREDVAP